MVINSKFSEQEIKKGLYLVSTPIGNLKDITFRAVEILKKSNYILCEDTRISQILLKKYEIKSKLISNHKFNENKNLSKVIELLKKGLIVSLISDAGTPSISDPGAILVKKCIENDIEIFPIPGASAVSSAVSISGFSEQFYFYGFFPDKMGILKKDLKILSQLNSSIVFFVSPRKINKIIPNLKENFSGRKVLICREMSKLYEEFIRSEIDELKPFNQSPKGEFTIIISEKENIKKNSQELSESDKRTIKKMINKLSIKEIINLINKDNIIPKKKIYNYCLKVKNEN
jgi:16S rRNA (cytidine1402-2'-O)-methyltransferase